MAFRKVNDDYQVETLINGKKDESGDRFYSYKIISKKSKEEVLHFCQKNLKKSFPKDDKPNVLSPELIEFRNLTNLNDPSMGDMFSYKVKLTNTT